jgi:hypothetical protein
MDKIMAQQEPEGPKTVNNNNTLVVAEAVSTAELIKRMKG